MSSSSSTASQTPSSSPSTASKEIDFKDDEKPDGWWLAKPCIIYQDEYRDCRRIRARFHQYFVHGKIADCSGWGKDYDNCLKWEKKRDKESLEKVIESERDRVRERLRSHYGNDTWKTRQTPPSDWNKDLPEFITKGYENSFLKMKAEEIKNGLPVDDEVSFWESNNQCVIS